MPTNPWELAKYRTGDEPVAPVVKSFLGFKMIRVEFPAAAATLTLYFWLKKRLWYSEKHICQLPPDHVANTLLLGVAALFMWTCATAYRDCIAKDEQGGSISPELQSSTDKMLFWQNYKAKEGSSPYSTLPPVNLR